MLRPAPQALCVVLDCTRSLVIAAMPLPEPASLAFDDVVIDFAGRRLLRGGAEQALEPKAFGVLALLVGAPGQVFARDDILDAVWGHRHVTRAC